VSVPPVVSLDAVRRELPAASAYAEAAGLALATDHLAETNLAFRVTFMNLHGEAFLAEFDCRDYPMYPPTVEFVDPLGGPGRGIASLYPSCFHGMPCVCARYNRKAYTERGGPHGDWRLVDWQLPTGNGVAIDSLAMIVSDLHSKISQSVGRLG